MNAQWTIPVVCLHSLYVATLVGVTAAVHHIEFRFGELRDVWRGILVSAMSIVTQKRGGEAWRHVSSFHPWFLSILIVLEIARSRFPCRTVLLLDLDPSTENGVATERIRTTTIFVGFELIRTAAGEMLMLSGSSSSTSETFGKKPTTASHRCPGARHRPKFAAIHPLLQQPPHLKCYRLLENKFLCHFPGCQGRLSTTVMTDSQQWKKA
ncbi:hypothetical protein SESBI_26889 [Sesbania bispinosa]|nr:hypothetical protein SESBI_26889 [Sesbania bispinosa]